MRRVDYLVVGQGICGTLLSRALMNAGQSVMVIDPGNGLSASRAAGGIINPVTGKRMVNSWMVEELMPVAWDTYRAMETEIDTAIIKRSEILDFYATQEARGIFTDRQREGNTYLEVDGRDEEWTGYFRYNYGYGRIAPAMLLDINAMLDGWRRVLESKEALTRATFDISESELMEEGIRYKDIAAKKALFCDGAVCCNNPYFNKLPWAKDKGEALVVELPGLPMDKIFRQGSLSIAPWQDGRFWIGATHDWKYTDPRPTEAYRKKVEEQLDYWLKIPYTITEHIVALRPANMERKPFVGLHPLHPAIGIFNGMGGKGCLQAPYFAERFARYLAENEALPASVDMARYKGMLSR